MQVAPLFVALVMVALAQGTPTGVEYDSPNAHLLSKRNDAGDGASHNKELTMVAGGMFDEAFPSSNPVHKPGHNCASVSIPARVAIQFCGCNDPACPRCPCA